MRDGPSQTALAVCAFRAREQHLPASARLLDDPYAQHFLPAGLLRSVAALNGSPWVFADGLASGVATYAVSRHRLLDEWLAEGLQASSQQVVVVGAGYDSRAWRLRGLLGDRLLFEVDHPHTATRKHRCIDSSRESFGDVPRVAVQVDLSVERLAPSLQAAGFNPSLQTTWIWEGVSMYLTPDAVLAAVQGIAGLSAPGSELLMDLGMPSDARGWTATWLRGAAQLLGVVGEPIRSGYSHAAATTAFGSAGGRLIEVVDGYRIPARIGHPERSCAPMAWCARIGLGADG
jgi:methyltransferase (TIGR00027 family)